MDDFKRAFYEVTFERDFLKKTENSFQDFFSEIMEKCYPSDFIRVRPWGNVGDRKNDGYLKSQRILFQVYAPNEMEATKAIKKIDEDFRGALPYWQAHFDQWIFVHNSRNGLGPDVTKKLLDLAIINNLVRVLSWGYEELRIQVFNLNEVDLASLLGPAPSNKDMQNIGFKELEIVLRTIAQQVPSEPDLRPVPPNKVASNALSNNVEMLLNTGMRKAHLVGRFFNEWHDPTFGDKMAEAFKHKYNSLRNSELLPDEIFAELIQFALGNQIKDAGYLASVTAVLAYFFEQCDIFERPNKKVIS